MKNKSVKLVLFWMLFFGGTIQSFPIISSHNIVYILKPYRQDRLALRDHAANIILQYNIESVRVPHKEVITVDGKLKIASECIPFNKADPLQLEQVWTLKEFYDLMLFARKTKFSDWGQCYGYKKGEVNVVKANNGFFYYIDTETASFYAKSESDALYRMKNYLIVCGMQLNDSQKVLFRRNLIDAYLHNFLTYKK